MNGTGAGARPARRRFGSSTTAEDLKAFMAPFVARLGYKFNTDTPFVDAVLASEIGILDRSGDIYCPCRVRTGDLKQDAKIVCPCIPYFLDEFSAMRKCWCGLFIRADVEDGAALHGIVARSAGTVEVRVAARDDLSAGQARVVRIGPRELALVRLQDDYFCLGGLCRHLGGLLGEGFVDGESLMCPRHGWRYEIRKGTTDHPGADVSVYPVTVRGDEVFVTM